MKRNFLFVAALFLCLGTSIASADEASKTAKVEEFFKLAKMDETLRQALTLATSQVQSGLMQNIMGVKLSADQEKALADLQGKVNTLISDALGWDKLKPEYLKLFMDAYSETELDDILAFYKSPTGQAMVQKTPALMTKSSQIAQQRMMAVQPELQKLIRDFVLQAPHPAADANK